MQTKVERTRVSTSARSLCRWLTIVALAWGSAVVVVGVPAPAHAASATIHVADGVLFADCAGHPVRVAASVPSGSREWVANVNLSSPSGDSLGVQTLTGRSSGTKTARWTFCLNGHPPGDYTARLDGYWTDSSGDIHFFARSSETFHLRIARSRTRISVSDQTPRPRERVTVRSRTLEERPGGRWAPVDYGYVRLQRRGGDGWSNVANSSAFVNSNGAVEWDYVWRKRQVFDLRAFAHELSGQRLSKSGAVTIRVRRGG